MSYGAIARGVAKGIQKAIKTPGRKTIGGVKVKKIPTRIHVAISITIPLKSKYKIPKMDIIIIPTALYNLSTKIIGAVIFLGVPKFSFNS